MSTTLRFLNLRVERDHLDRETGRRAPLDEPFAVLMVATEKGTVRDVHLTRTELLTLAAKATDAALMLHRGDTR